MLWKKKSTYHRLGFIFNTSKTSKSNDNKKLQNLSIVTQFYPPDYAATGQLIQELAIQLTGHNIKASVFTGQPGYAFSEKTAFSKEVANKVEIRRTRTTRFWSKRLRGKTINGILFCIRVSLHLLKHWHHIDILLLTTAPPFLSIIGYFNNLLFGTPYICLVYDLYPDVVTGLKVSNDSSLIIKFWRLANKIVWHKAQHIIVISSTMKDRLLVNYPCLEDKVSVIENWADPHQIKP